MDMNQQPVPRTASHERKTAETAIRVQWTLDGRGHNQIKTLIPFLDHMLNLFGKHGFFDLTVEAKGDIEIDDHHTIEDIGIVMGQVLTQALGTKEGITRFGWAAVPLDETLAQVSFYLSGLPYLVYNVALPTGYFKSFDLGLFEDFFQAFVSQGGLNLHVNVPYGRNPHHIMEAVFKAFAKALDQAVRREDRIKGVLSTKGSL
jgi:imidazoleglycerol-phosphate dehydratase